MKAMCAKWCSYGLVLAAALPAWADVAAYSAGYQVNYRQADGVAPSVYGAAFFCAISADAGDATSASITSGPTGETIDLFEVLPGIFQGGVAFGDEASMHAAFPGGSYLLAVTGGSLGNQSGEIEMLSPPHYPDTVPAFDAAQIGEYQSINGLADYEFRFNTFSSSGTLDQAYVVIDAYPSTRRVFFAPVDPRSGSVIVPAGTLRLNRRYVATLLFLSVIERENAGFQNATSGSNAWYTTDVLIRTAGDCPSDYNGDGFVDFFDFADFVAEFESGDPYADYNSDGFIDFFDYNDFVAAFETGC